MMVTEDNKAFRVSTSGAHCAVSTLKMELYTWSTPGDPSGCDGHAAGQLGHGSTASYRTPKRVAVGDDDDDDDDVADDVDVDDSSHSVQGLYNEHIASVGCGLEFTIALTENGRSQSHQYMTTFAQVLHVGLNVSASHHRPLQAIWVRFE